MTTTFSAAALRMPYSASVAALAPLAPGAKAEPCAPNQAHGLELGGIIAPAFAGRLGGTDGSDRFGGGTRSSIRGWHRQDSAQLTGGGPLRG